MTDIQPYTAPLPEIATTDTWVPVLADVANLASKIADTDFVPSAYKGNTAAVAASILYGRELGLPPMTALTAIDPIKGTPSLSAEAMRALIFAAGHELRFVESTATRCVIEGRRKGQEAWTRESYTMDEAKQSGDANKNPQYRSRPKEMMVARATSRIARMMFAECIGGFPAPEDIDYDTETTSETSPKTVTIERETARKVEQTPAKNRRKTTPKAAPETQAPAIAQVPVMDGPPLPGEDGFEQIAPTSPAPEPEVVDAEIVDDEPAEPTITPAQSKKLFATLRDLGIDQREPGLEMIGNILGREVESTKTLSKTDASMVIDTLTTMQSQSAPTDDPGF